ncbi:MAG: polysaccharide biosynthesis C-terminal domain-containing protein [Saprospiraceae bacterium]|nr:polysaccharide biosynthesis C-terminal domain-containing protein [Saprospiraceae bacterium]
MGVVRRQSIKRTTVSYLGVLIGTISVLKIYPLAFEIYGMSQFIISSATLIMPFASIGISRLTVRYFPEFKNEETKNHGFLGFLLMLSLLFFLIFGLFLFLFKDAFFALLAALDMKKEAFWENRGVIMVVSLALIISSILGQYASNFKRIVVPEIFNNLLIKIALPILVLLFYFGYIAENEFRYLYALSFLLAILGLAGYLIYLGQFNVRLDFSFLKKPLVKEMMVYSAFNALSIIGYLLSFRIDNIMITSFMDYDNTGHYSFFAYIVNVIVIPYMSMIAIASPIISQGLRDADLASIQKLYRQSSETLFIVGLYIVGGVWLCMDPLLEITGKSDLLSPLKYTFLILAAGQLFNITTGLTEPIIGYSKYYRFNLYTMTGLALMNIIMNFYFIPKFGILGAALATAVSLVVYNFIQCVFIYDRFGMLPVSHTHVKVLFFASMAYFAANLFYLDVNPVLQILIRGSIFSLIFLPMIIYFKVSPEVDRLWRDIKTRVML